MNDSLNPILLAYELPPVGGGISRLCHEIRQNGKNVGLHFHTLSQVPRAQYSVAPRRPLRELQTLWQLRKINSSFILSGIWYPEGWLASWKAGGKKVVLAHGLELMPSSRPSKEYLWKRMRQQTLESADLVIANSHYTGALVSQVAPKAQVSVIPLAVDHHRFQPQVPTEVQEKDTLKLLTVARLHSYKGFETVFQALAGIPGPFRKTVRYQIAGTGPDRERLESQSKELGVSEQIDWLGFVPEDDLAKLYSDADLFVMMTRESESQVEGFGLSFLEAQACGTPVIGTRTGGIPDAISEGRGGWLLQQNAYEELRDKIVHLLENRKELETQGQFARERVLSEATWEHYIKQFRSTLEQHEVIE